MLMRKKDSKIVENQFDKSGVIANQTKKFESMSIGIQTDCRPVSGPSGFVQKQEVKKVVVDFDNISESDGDIESLERYFIRLSKSEQ
jgi:hypothetical protein